MTELPSTINTLLCSIYQSNQPIVTLILNTTNVEIQHKKGHAIVTLDETPKKEMLDAECADIMIAYCDDPTMLHAGDWGDLGTTRILIDMKDAVLQKKASGTKKCVWRCTLREINIIMPEREVPDEITRTEFYI